MPVSTMTIIKPQTLEIKDFIIHEDGQDPFPCALIYWIKEYLNYNIDLKIAQDLIQEVRTDGEATLKLNKDRVVVQFENPELFIFMTTPPNRDTTYFINITPGVTALQLNGSTINKITLGE